MLNKEAYAYGKKLIRVGAVNLGNEWSGGATEARHYLGDGEYPFIAPVMEKDTVFRAAILKILEEAFGDEDMTEAAEELLKRLDDADVLDGDTETSGDDKPSDPPGDVPFENPGKSMKPESINEAAQRRLKLERALIKKGSGRLERAAKFDTENIDLEALTVPLAFSSEDPYERWFGVEILGHKRGEVRTKRMKKGLSVLVDHWSDLVGITEGAKIDTDAKGRCVARFSKNNEYAVSVFNDIADGIRRYVSVGYMVHKMREEVAAKDEQPAVWRVTDWEPLEVSIVAVPADIEVGVLRSMASGEAEIESTEIGSPHRKEKNMDEEKKTIETPEVDVEKVEREAVKVDRQRGDDIRAYGRLHEVPQENIDGAISDGTSLIEFGRTEAERRQLPSKPIKAGDIGLSEPEKKDYSFHRAINALANPNDRAAQEAASFERDCSTAAGKALGKTPQGFLVPDDILRRDMTVSGTSSASVATDLLAGSWIDLLRNKSLALKLGTSMTGLVGDVAIPKLTAGATAYWVTEGNAVTESTPTLGQATLTPHTVGAWVDYSRKFLIQSTPDANKIITDDLSSVVALAADLAAFHGSGSSGQPTGIAATSGIGSVAGGTNGLAPAWSHIVKLETEVAVDNADVGRLGYVTNSKVRGKLKETVKESGTAAYVWGEDSRLNGYDAHVTNQVSSALTKGSASGVCSAIFYGNFADLLLGFWSGLDLTADPYTNATSGTVRVIALQDMDVAVRHAESFAAMLDALTT